MLCLLMRAAVIVAAMRERDAADARTPLMPYALLCLRCCHYAMLRYYIAAEPFFRRAC